MTQKNNQSLSSRIDAIHDTMFDSLGNFFIKNLKGEYLYLNKNVAITAGISNPSHILGKNDRNHEFPWAEYGELYERNSISTNPCKETVKFMELIKTHDGKTSLIVSHKKPFYHQDKLVGMCGLSLITHDTSASSLRISLTKDHIFFDMKNSKIIHLSTKQRVATHLLLQSLSPKQVAEKMLLSQRTIEHYIDAIKDKCRYTSTKELLVYLRII